jgi:hypothetical protein
VGEREGGKMHLMYLEGSLFFLVRLGNIIITQRQEIQRFGGKKEREGGTIMVMLTACELRAGANLYWK